MYPELITRTDLKVFMPPIGGSTIYMFGDTNAITDPDKKLCVRVHTVPRSMVEARAIKEEGQRWEESGGQPW